MRRLLPALLFLSGRLAAAIALPDSPSTLTPEQIAERSLPSIVLVRTPAGMGTGFVVRADGRIATNLHVIEGAIKATVVMPDKRELLVDTVALDPKHDLAVLHIAATGLIPLALGDSDKVKPGEPVVAIGHPMGLGNTVSNGLISAVRELSSEMKLIQISAPLSFGSSGGPLIDEHGAVVGISTLITVEGQNLNFGMPVNYLKPLVDAAGEELRLAPNASRPKIRREIPNHPIGLLDGCSDEDLQKIRDAIADAISLGAPLYNQGNTAACFRIYQGTALDLHRSMKTCSGPRDALMVGVKKAEKAADDSGKAWRMRDAFDGVIDVIERKLGKSEGASGRELTKRRVVPKFDVSLLKACKQGDIDMVGKSIADAINLGAPLYNEGNISACFRIYQSASLEMIRKLSHCKKVREALQSVVDQAGDSDSDEERAWILRDQFDGLVDVITRQAADK